MSHVQRTRRICTHILQQHAFSFTNGGAAVALALRFDLGKHPKPEVPFDGQIDEAGRHDLNPLEDLRMRA